MTPIASICSASRLLLRILRPESRRVSVVFGCVLALGIVPAIQIWIFQGIVSAIGGGTAFPKLLGGVGQIGVGVTLYGFAVSVNVIIQAIRGHFTHALRESITIAVQELVMDTTFGLSMESLESPEFYDDLQVIQRNSSAQPMVVFEATLSIVQSVVSVLSIVAVLDQVPRWLILGVLISTLPGIAIQAVYGKRTYRLALSQSSDRRFAQYIYFIATSSLWFKDIKTLNLENALLSRFSTVADKSFHESKDLSRDRSKAGVIGSLVAVMAQAFAISYVAIRATTGSMSLSGAIAAMQGFGQLGTSFGSVLGSIQAIHESSRYLTQFARFLERGSEKCALSAALPLATEMTAEPEMYFDGVSMRYQGSISNAIENITLHIPFGSHVAIVGASGSGKSTLIKLACGLYKPTVGKVRIGDHDVSNYPPAYRTRLISVLYQDPALLQMTVLENVTRLENLYSNEYTNVGFWRALELADAVEIINGLRQKEKTYVGTWFENGVELSGGELQRIALARALYWDAPILILDEPTAALDPHSERRILEKLRSPMRRTLILITHRMDMARLMDRVVVMDGGRIVEDGAPTNLLSDPYSHFSALTNSSSLPD